VDVGGGGATSTTPVAAASGTPQTDPAAGTGAIPTETAQVDRPAPTGGKNWAKAGGIVGIVGGAAAGLLGAASAYFNEVPPEGEDAETYTTSLAFGVGATLMLAVSVPVAYLGSRSARQSAGVDGKKGLRIAGWATYGAGLGGAVGVIATSFAMDQAVTGLIVAVSVLGAGAGALMGAEALIAGKQAKQAKTADRSQIGIGVAPLPGRTGIAGGVVGVGGRF
jgi:hypothetical protein